MKRLTNGLLITWLCCAIGYVSADEVAGDKIYKTQCAHCHGPQALGDQATSSPRLAGQKMNYLVEQLKHFQNGKRGCHPEDQNGSIMVGISSGINEGQIESVSSYLSALDSQELPRLSQLNEKGKKGMELYLSTCADCHGVNGAGSENLFTPNLAILNGWYVRNQFEAYTNGWRGSADCGSTRSKAMRAIMGQIISEKEQEALIELISGGG